VLQRAPRNYGQVQLHGARHGIGGGRDHYGVDRRRLPSKLAQAGSRGAGVSSSSDRSVTSGGQAQGRTRVVQGRRVRQARSSDQGGRRAAVRAPQGVRRGPGYRHHTERGEVRTGDWGRQGLPRQAHRRAQRHDLGALQAAQRPRVSHRQARDAFVLRPSGRWMGRVRQSRRNRWHPSRRSAEVAKQPLPAGRRSRRFAERAGLDG